MHHKICAVQRKQKLEELVGEPALLMPEQTTKLHQFLGEHHEALCLEANERGETDLLTMKIAAEETGCMPYAVCSEG